VSAAAASPGRALDLELPPEPVALLDRTRRLAEQDPAAAGALLERGEWIARPLWDRWGPALRQAGWRRRDLVAVLVAYRRELWLWVMGERTWSQCAAGLLGRVRRRA
jgi:hypothetical protein